MLAPRLSKADILGFDAICTFSRLTPVAKCLQQVIGTGLPPQRKKAARQTADTLFSQPATNGDLKPHASWIEELIALSRDILADGVVTEGEIIKLQDWLTGCPCTQLYPINVIADKVEQIVCDGIITAEERAEMKQCLDTVLHVVA